MYRHTGYELQKTQTPVIQEGGDTAFFSISSVLCKYTHFKKACLPISSPYITSFRIILTYFHRKLTNANVIYIYKKKLKNAMH